jgi:hypothetical protein
MSSKIQDEEKRNRARRVCGRKIVPERSTEEERSSKRCDIRNEVSREDTRSSGSRIEENEVRSPWLVRDVVTSEEDGAQSSSIDTTKNSDGSLQEGAETLVIMRRLAWLEIGSSFGSIT